MKSAVWKASIFAAGLGLGLIGAAEGIARALPADARGAQPPEAGSSADPAAAGFRGGFVTEEGEAWKEAARRWSAIAATEADARTAYAAGIVRARAAAGFVSVAGWILAVAGAAGIALTYPRRQPAAAPAPSPAA